MSKQANKTMIGGFIVGAVALVVAGVLVFGSGRFLTERLTYVLHFEGSVKGLNIGSPVLFRGVKVGTVKDIQIQADPETVTIQIPVLIDLEPKRFGGDRRARDPEARFESLLKAGLRARLELQSLVTGQLMVELDFHPDTTVKLVDDESGYPEIPTIQSGMQELARTIEKLPLDQLATKLTSAIAGIERAVNSPDVTEIISTLNQTLQDLQKLVRNVDNRIEPLASSLEDTIEDYGKLARDVDEKVEPLASGVDKVLKDTRKLVRNIDGQVTPLLSSVQRTAKLADAALVQAEQTLKTIEGVAGKDSAVVYQLTNMMKELSAAARSIRAWANYLERHPEALIRGKSGSRGR
jgi:paraquat-inducible protein B